MPDHARFRTVFISDLHLGCDEARANEVADFLKCVRCDTLYLVGDIIDMWRLCRRWHWPDANNRVVRRVLKMAKRGTRVVFIPGNHDDPARQYIGINFGGVELRLNDIHETADGRRLLVTHGDQFDLVIRHARLVSLLGAWAYERLLKLNKHYNMARAVFGYEYWSLSRFLKLKVKSACTFVSNFEQELTKEAAGRGLDGVVCGHIHHAEVRRGAHAGVDYFNCGDWVEQSSALVEHDDGRMELIDGAALAREVLARRALSQHNRAEGPALDDDAWPEADGSDSAVDFVFRDGPREALLAAGLQL
ncbi:MAG TPA: UDP-2,3-diacylglucosamine diphosphatase [Phycisphaerales bacterium]|nr:UDP-2,3-diacylglucosamine diphosphatase [Phycisphaerales bacterium]